MKEKVGIGVTVALTAAILFYAFTHTKPPEYIIALVSSSYVWLFGGKAISTAYFNAVNRAKSCKEVKQ